MAALATAGLVYDSRASQTRGLKSMHSYQITEWGQPLERLEQETPEPKGSEVLVRIEACGVCHSDLHIWDGYFDMGGGKRITLADRGTSLPFTLGRPGGMSTTSSTPFLANLGIRAARYCSRSRTTWRSESVSSSGSVPMSSKRWLIRSSRSRSSPIDAAIS